MSNIDPNDFIPYRSVKPFFVWYSINTLVVALSFGYGYWKIGKELTSVFKVYINTYLCISLITYMALVAVVFTKMNPYPRIAIFWLVKKQS